jgi:tRNA threonylcarbamoyladenosine biosynthesis protein TsaE
VLNFLLEVNNLNETIKLSRKLANCCAQLKSSFIIYLIGDLGAGKTTMAQYFIKYFGFERVKSPTYSLVESYQNDEINIHHFDCYRLHNPEELEYIGMREYSLDGHIQLFEWPDLGKGMIPNPDISISLSGKDDKRKIGITAHTDIGRKISRCVTS